MKKLVPFLPVVGILLVLAGSSPGVQPEAEKEAMQKIIKKLLAAIETNDRDAFLADATKSVKDRVTKEAMEELSSTFGLRLKQGYATTYLCQLKQAGFQVHLWKATFKDGGDDAIIRVVTKEGKVEGFFLQ